jgi:hypothetical protein
MASADSQLSPVLQQFRVAAVRRQFDLLPSSELPGLATSALEAGLDSPSLRLLAGEMQPTWADSGPLFESALRDLGIPYEPPPQAGLALALHYARQISSGALRPYDGARHIWWDVANKFMDDPVVWDQLRIFVGLASEYEDYPPARAKFEQQIRDEAGQLLQRNA